MTAFQTVHPCRTGNPGTTMHACTSENLEQTLCGLDVDIPSISRVWGFKKLCPGCYPATAPQPGDPIEPGDPIQIPGREKLPDFEDESKGVDALRQEEHPGDAAAEEKSGPVQSEEDQ